MVLRPKPPAAAPDKSTELTRPRCVEIHGREFCAEVCGEILPRVYRTKGHDDLTHGRATHDPLGLPTDEAALAFAKRGGKPSFEDFARITCPKIRATTMVTAGLTHACACLDRIVASADPTPEEKAKLDDMMRLARRINDEPWKRRLPRFMTAHLDRGYAGKTKSVVRRHTNRELGWNDQPPDEP